MDAVERDTTVGIGVLDDLAALYGARGYLRDLKRNGLLGEALETAIKELTTRIGHTPTTDHLGAGKLKEWHEIADKKRAVQAWRRAHDEALPPLTSRSVHAGLPGLRADLDAKGGIVLRDTLATDQAVQVGSPVVVKPHLTGDPQWGGRKGVVTRVIISDEESAERLAGKGKDDFRGVSLMVRTENGAEYAGKVDQFALDGAWAPPSTKTPDPDGNDLLMNPHWHRKPAPVSPWRLLAKLVAADDRSRDCAAKHQQAPASEDAYMFHQAAEDHLRRVGDAWTKWATQHPTEAEKCLRMHKAHMALTSLDIPLPAATHW